MAMYLFRPSYIPETYFKDTNKTIRQTQLNINEELLVKGSRLMHAWVSFLPEPKITEHYFSEDINP